MKLHKFVPRTNMKSRRYKIFDLELEALKYILEGRLEIYGLPEDVKVISADFSHIRFALQFILESETFEEVAVGLEIPHIGQKGIKYNILEVPKEQFGCSIFLVKENTEKLVDKEGQIKFREFI